MATKERFGFVGLGAMGGHMARRLVEADFDLVVFDAAPEKLASFAKLGATAAASLRELWDSADIVFISLPTPEIVRSVVLGDEGVAPENRTQIVIDLSTTGIEVEKRLAAALEEQGKRLLDCPVSGGSQGAAEGTLALMFAGNEADVARALPAFKVLGNPYHVGPTPGMGQTVKVINNLMSTAALTITSEAMVLGVKAGLSPEIMLDVFNASSGRNTTTDSKFPRHMLDRTFDFGMSIELSSKDARLCLEQAEKMGVPMVVGSAVKNMLNITRDRFGGDVDMTQVLRIVEEWAHVEVTRT